MVDSAKAQSPYLQTAAILFARAAQIIIQFGFVSIIIRELGPAVAGKTAIVLALLTVSRAIIPFGGDVVVLREAARSKGLNPDIKRLLRRTASRTLLVSMVASIFSVVYLHVVVGGDQLIFGAVAFLTPIGALLGLLVSFLRATKSAIISQLNDSLVGQTVPMFLVLTVGPKRLGLDGFFVLLTLFGFLCLAITVALTLFHLRSLTGKPEDLSTSGQLDIGIGQVVSALLPRLPIILAGLFILPREITYFDLGSKYTLFGATLIWAAGTALSPYFAKTNEIKSHYESNLYRNYLVTLLALNFVAWIAVLVMTPWLAKYLGLNFDELVATFMIMGLAGFADTPVSLYSYKALMTGQERQSLRLNLTNLAVTATLVVPLSIHLGAIGLSIAVLSGSAVRFFAYLAATRGRQLISTERLRKSRKFNV